MVSLNLKVLAKFGPCSNCSQKLHECSLARARKIFAEKCTRNECFWKHIIHPRFADVLLKLAQVTILLERHPQKEIRTQ